jgi:hypothetical protein
VMRMLLLLLPAAAGYSRGAAQLAAS